MWGGLDARDAPPGFEAKVKLKAAILVRSEVCHLLTALPFASFRSTFYSPITEPIHAIGYSSHRSSMRCSDEICVTSRRPEFASCLDLVTEQSSNFGRQFDAADNKGILLRPSLPSCLVRREGKCI